jgi:hypothetical protein
MRVCSVSYTSPPPTLSHTHTTTAQEALLDDYFFSEPYPQHSSHLCDLVQLPVHNDAWRAVYGQWDPTQPFDIVQHFDERLQLGGACVCVCVCVSVCVCVF